MATIAQVAKHILQQKGRMSTMKLQKLTYYCQAWSLAWDEESLFDEDFQAWANGPVSIDLFNFHRGKFSICLDDLSQILDGEFTELQLETMGKVLDFYSSKDSLWLSELTHKEEPWKSARGNTPMGMASDEIITKDSMQQYYGGLIG